MSKTAAVFNKKKFINDVTETVRHMYRKQLKEASQQEIFQAVSYVVKDVVIDDWLATQQAFDDQDPKIVYYMSMEFLMGRALGNNLINLKAYKEVKEALEEIGLNLDVIEDQEPDPALGNGGLGRLAACFMESLATLGYAAYGCGFPGFSCNTELQCIWMWYPLSLWYVQTADFGWFSGRGTG